MKKTFAEILAEHAGTSACDNAMGDLLLRIETASKLPNSNAKNPLAINFFNRFLPVNWEPTALNHPYHTAFVLMKDLASDHTIPEDVLALAMGASLLYGVFYSPASKHEQAAPISVPCDYEAIIPFNQPSPFWTYYIIARASHRPGRLGPVLRFGFLNRISPVLETVLSESKLPPFTPPNGMNFSKFMTFMNTLLDKKTEFEKELGGSIGYGISDLVEEPGLRLPCCNIALQCAYEMVSEDVGGFAEDLVSLYVSALENERTKITLKRKPLNHTNFLAALSWTSWELLQFSERERLEHLIACVHDFGKPCDFKLGHTEKCVVSAQEALRIRCHRMFENHLKARKADLQKP